MPVAEQDVPVHDETLPRQDALERAERHLLAGLASAASLAGSAAMAFTALRRAARTRRSGGGGAGQR